MSVADAAFVGTSLKENGIFENPVSKDNVKELMSAMSAVIK